MNYSTQPQKVRNSFNKFLRYFAVAVVAACVYIFFQLTPIKKTMKKIFHHDLTILIIEVTIIFTIVYITNQLVLRQCYIDH